MKNTKPNQYHTLDIKPNKHGTFSSDVHYKKNIIPHHQQLELTSIPTTHTSSTAITDSGCTHDLTSFKSLLEYLVYFKTPLQALLGDETTHLPIVAYGMMNYFINGHRIRRIGYYVPTLGTTSRIYCQPIGGHQVL